MTRAAAMIALGKQFVGKIGYKYGSKLPEGRHLSEVRVLDCSGWTEGLARECGVHLPAGSQNQLAACHAVPLSVALGPEGAGCLVFMRSRGGRPGHVGISLGNGATLECCSGHGVAIMQRSRGAWDVAGKIPEMMMEADHGDTRPGT